MDGPREYHTEWTKLDREGEISWHTLYVELASLVAQSVKNLPAVQETRGWSLGREDPLEKEMATHSRVLAWKISWTVEPGGLQLWGRKESGTTGRLTLTYTWNLKKNDANELTKHKETQRLRKWSYGFWGEKEKLGTLGRPCTHCYIWNG